MEALIDAPAAAPKNPGLKVGTAHLDRDPVTGKLLPKSRRVLGTETTTDLAAMEWVATNGVDETHQHVYYRRLWTEEPRYFAERLRELQAEAKDAKAETVVTVSKCDSEAEVAEPVELLIQQLLEECEHGV